jgi:hypothetical protein
MRPVAPDPHSRDATLKILQISDGTYDRMPASVGEDGIIMVEWELSREDVAAILEGGRVRLWLAAERTPFIPVTLEIVLPPSNDIEAKVKRALLVTARET